MLPHGHIGNSGHFQAHAQTQQHLELRRAGICMWCSASHAASPRYTAQSVSGLLRRDMDCTDLQDLWKSLSHGQLVKMLAKTSSTPPTLSPGL